MRQKEPWGHASAIPFLLAFRFLFYERVVSENESVWISEKKKRFASCQLLSYNSIQTWFTGDTTLQLSQNLHHFLCHKQFYCNKILIWFSRSLECTHYEAATNMITFIICTSNIKFSVVYQIECDIYFMTYFKIRFLWKTTSRNTFTFSETIYVSWNEQIHYRKHW